MPIDQATRPIAIATPLGDNAVVLRSFNASERLGRLFQINAELLSDNFQVPFDKILGQNVTIRLDTGTGSARFFNGFVSRFAQAAPFGRLARYQATIVPWLWFLTRNADCRIFQNMAVPDIIKQIFRDRGFTDFEDLLTANYRTWEYCVQYRETDFNFVSRLMEQEGIYYYFEHDDGSHKLILADGRQGHKPLPDYEQIPYRIHGGSVIDEECISDWSISQEVQSGVYALESFDFKLPGKELASGYGLSRPNANSEFEIFDYPHDYVDPSDGETYSRVRLEELQAQFEVAQAQTDVRGICTGYTFELIDFPREEQEREYLITSALYHAEADSFEAGNGGGTGRQGGRPYSCSFNAMDAQSPFRPQRVTSKPTIQGPQTAIVVGPAGQEIYLDEFGRVKVQFHWDRYGKRDENASCWVRVSQGWAGKQWGIAFHPRIDQEVIIEFIEGDPDQPIITGRVYNGDNMPPYALPASGTVSTMKSRSSKGGSPANFNELKFEDKKGGELVYMQAEKDLRIHVKASETENVGSSISTSAGGSISRSAGGDISRTSDKNITDKATGSLTVKTGKEMSLKSGTSYQLVTNQGIHLKTINFMMELIESGIASAMASLKGDAKEGVDAAKGIKKGDNAKADALGHKVAGQMASAFGPAVGAGAGELHRMCDVAEKGEAKLGPEAAHAADAAKNLEQTIAKGGSAEAVAGALIGLASAAFDAYKDAKAVLDALLPQIPSIVMWAMKDISGEALWGVSFTARFRDISLETKTRDVHIKAKKKLNLEATTQDLNIKAGTKSIQMTGKQKISIKAEDDNLVIETGKNMTIKAKDKMQLKCGSASITLLESGDILIKGGTIKIKGSEAVEVKGTPIKLN